MKRILRSIRHRLTSQPLCRWVVWAACISLLAGCQSGIYRASKLPDQFRVPPTPNSDVMSFSGLSRAGANGSLIAAGDLLEVTVETGRGEKPPTPIKTQVATNGTIQLALIGPIEVAGLEAFSASHRIEQIAVQRGIYVRPQVAVEIKEKAINRITVLGKVDEPGVHEIPRGSSDLLSAIAAAGGLTEEAGTEVEIRRSNAPLANTAPAQSERGSATGIKLAGYEELPSPVDSPYPETSAQYPSTAQGAVTGVYPPPYFSDESRPGENPPGEIGPYIPDLAAPGTTRLDLTNQVQTESANLHLSDGDVVYVFPRPERMIYVGGLVKEPGQFEIPRNQDIDLIQAIQMAGDIRSSVADKVLVLRRIPGRPEPLVIKASIRKAKHNGRENIRLTTGDVVSVEQTPATVAVETLMNFFRVSVGVAGRSTIF